MSKYKGEGYSTTFNYGIRTNLISSRCFVLSRQTSLRKAIKAQALREYNLYKYLLYRRDLESLDGAEIMMLSDDYNNN